MLLAIDEIVNVTTDSTVVIHGMDGNVYDLPQALERSNPAEIFRNFFSRPDFHVLAPSVQSDTPPPSFVAAKALFPIKTQAAFALWPDDAPFVPAYKRALVQVPFANAAPSFPVASWIFVVAPNGGLVATAVQLLTYAGLGGQGEGLTIGADRSLVGSPVEMRFSPEPGSQPPKVKHALRMTSWKLPSGAFDLDVWSKHALAPAPYFPPLDAWGAAVTQTILLATESPPRNVHWTRPDRSVHDQDFIPSPPILHVTLVVGGSITIKRSWERDFQARLIEPAPSSAPIWANFSRMMLTMTGAVMSEIAPAPLSHVIDHFFDEYDKALDKVQEQLPPWLYP